MKSLLKTLILRRKIKKFNSDLKKYKIKLAKLEESRYDKEHLSFIRSQSAKKPSLKS